MEAAVAHIRGLVAPGVCTTQAVTPVALQQTYTTKAGAGLIAIELKSGKVVHQSPSFQDLTRSVRPTLPWP